jgi:glucose-6-phosphate dehydrogenase assembly protein OpcA
MKIWEGLAKEKMRACLFNLLVFNILSPRTEYVKTIVKNVSEKYPCRVIFISLVPKTTDSFLKCSVSVIGSGNIACDYISFEVAGKDLEKIPFIVLPHLIPDLPISLLWTEDPSHDHPLFTPLSKLATRIIFDSESADRLIPFCNQVLSLKNERADLNWARIEGWRDLIASLFRDETDLDQIEAIRITYNAKETESFCHTKVQGLYLLFWMADRLGWKFDKVTSDLHFFFKDKRAEIHAAHWEKLGSGTIISVDLATKDGHLYQCARIPTQYHYVSIQISSPEKCELPYQYHLGGTASGHSLTKEIITQGTSIHYTQMLSHLNLLKETPEGIQVC